VGDRHLNFHESRDNLGCRPGRAAGQGDRAATSPDTDTDTDIVIDGELVKRL